MAESEIIDPFAPVMAKSASPLSKAIREKWALVVGIGQFQDSKNIPALGHTVDDVTAFAALLADEHAGSPAAESGTDPARQNFRNSA